jgi:hypothetical protein
LPTGYYLYVDILLAELKTPFQEGNNLTRRLSNCKARIGTEKTDWVDGHIDDISSMTHGAV